MASRMAGARAGLPLVESTFTRAHRSFVNDFTALLYGRLVYPVGKYHPRIVESLDFLLLTCKIEDLRHDTGSRSCQFETGRERVCRVIDRFIDLYCFISFTIALLSRRNRGRDPIESIRDRMRDRGLI